MSDADFHYILEPRRNRASGSTRSLTIPDTGRHDLIFAIAEQISNAAYESIGSLDEEAVNRICKTLPRLLEGLSMSIGQQNPSSEEHMAVMLFIRKYCRYKQPSYDNVTLNNRDSPGVAGMEKNKGPQGIGLAKEPDGSIEPPLLGMDYPAPSSDNEDDKPSPYLPGIQACVSLIQSDIGFTKLQSDIHREYLTEVNRSEPPENIIMTFKVDWDPLDFLQREYPESSQNKLGNSVVLTGSIEMAQAQTCSEYLRQTWPCSGLDILKLIQDGVDNNWPSQLSCEPALVQNCQEYY
ncbi:hypothetical protein N7466_007395 [Penicillium verhagenii]|uniref:uncharacterized protein n=1 Tax=Penicillium verhagenii TaxID=1562060 RepID=UPI00254544AB|nr:uncharacterized protein N7466_007395 [Penicillium verhagenii]KAJ5928439.1 hypothetical protein N7466_007395 [Penicillium verhagenii]